MPAERSTENPVRRRGPSAATRRGETDDEVDAAVPPSPSLGRASLTGFVVGLALGLIVFFLVAMPFYMIRSIDLAGDARTFVRNGVLRGAVPAGLVAAVAGGIAVGRWRWRGGRLAEPGRRDFPGVTGPGGR